MLEALDRFDWKSVHHAYGPATDVPGWLRAMAKEGKRGKDFSSFVSAVNHQGSATPAALPAVPFLLELVASGAGPIAELTILLGDLAAAGDHTNVLRFGSEVIAAHPDGAALSAAVGAGLAVFRRLVARDSPRARAAATVPLAILGDGDGKSVKALVAAIEGEEKPEPLAAFLLALAWLGREKRDAKTVARLDEYAKHKATAVRVAAAIGACWLDASPARTRLLAAMVAKAPSSAAVPFGNGDLRGMAVAELAARSVRDGNVDAFLDLNDELDLVPERELYEVVLAAIAPELAKPPVEPVLATDFDGAQRRVLARLTQRVIARSKNAHVPLDAFDKRGILDPVRVFGGVAAGPLDEAVDGEPLWRHARRARDGRSEVSRWSAVVKEWVKGDAAKRDALARDCFANGHRLSMPYPYVDDEPIAEEWAKSAAWGAMLAATLEEVGPELLGELAQGTTRTAAYAVAPWVRARGGKPDATARRSVAEILGSEVREPSLGRAVLEALHPTAREALAKRCAFDIFVADSERPPRAYLRGAWHWLDLSPALTTKVCKEIASWDALPEAEEDPKMKESIAAEVTSMLARSPTARAAAKSLVARAKPAGRRILETLLAQAVPFARCGVSSA